MISLDDAIRSLISSTSVVGAKLFEALAQDLTRVLSVRVAIVAELLPDDPSSLRSVVFVDGTVVQPEIRHAVTGSPWEEVIRLSRPLRVPDGLGRTHRLEGNLARFAQGSFVGHPLLDERGTCVGVIAVLDESPMEDAASAETLLRLFAPRVEAELQRRRTDTESEETREFESLLNDLASRFLRAPLDELVLEVDAGARLVMELAGLSCSRLLEVDTSGDLETWCCCARNAPPSRCREDEGRLPGWIRAELLAGRRVIVGGGEADRGRGAEERAFFDRFAPYLLGVPFTSGEAVFGAMLLGGEASLPFDRWETLRQLSLAAEIFGHALSRHRREGALRQSEENYRKLLDLAPGAILVHSEGIVRFANQAACRMRGVAGPAAFVGRPVLDIVHPKDRPLAAERIRAVLLEGFAPPIEELLLREDGTAVEAMVAAALTTWEGKPAVQVVANDVSAVRRAERALASSEGRYRSLFEQAAVGIADFDLSGRFVRVNERYAEVTGQDVVSLPGRSGASIVHPDDIEAVRAEMAEVLGGRRDRASFEWRCLRADGKTAWIRSDVSMVRGGDGKPAHLMAVVADTTGGRAAQEVAQAAVAEIRERMEEWSATVDSLPLGLVVLDREGRVLRANRIAHSLATEARGERMAEEGWLVADLLSLEPWKAIVALTSSEVQAPAPVEVVDGMGRTWLVSYAPTILAAETRSMAVVTFADVTDTARLKERLERSERLALMGSLLSGVAHEVRNPLFAISANADALDLELEHDENMAEMLAALREGVARLRRVLEDLLDFGRSAPAAPATGAVDLAVLRALRSCDELVRAGSVRVESRVPDGVLVAMDERRLARALESVIGNALVWARSSVEIEVDGSFEEQGRRVLRLLVQDDGPGFDPEDLPRVFEPFYSRRRGATGLGLTIAQRILDQYGGSISVGNGEEGGALITLSLPLALSET